MIRLVPKKEVAPMKSEKDLFLLVKTAFNQRRKTLRNALQAVCSGERLLAAGIRPELRAEQLEVAEFIKLSNALARDAAATDIP